MVDGTSRCADVGDNPVNWLDPSGHQKGNRRGGDRGMVFIEYLFVAYGAPGCAIPVLVFAYVTSSPGTPWVNDKFTHRWAACASRRACGLFSPWSSTGMLSLILKEFGDIFSPERCFDLADLFTDV